MSIDFQTGAMIILAVVTISLVSLVGILLINVGLKKVSALISILVSIAAGTLLGEVFFHILPEVVVADAETSSLVMLVGVITFFLLEHALHWHHIHQHHTHHEHTKPVAYANLFADALHNFTDGLVIASAFLINTELGIATTIAVALHEIPQELGDFGVLIDAGFSKKKALLFNFFSAATSILGAVLVILAGSIDEALSNMILAFAAGGFLYIAMADLLPRLTSEQNRLKGTVQFAVVILAILGMYLLTFAE
jgi:zinc and cadmium transporter